MTKANKILIGALGLQVVLMVFVYTRSDATSVLPPRFLFDGFDAEAVTEIAISDAPEEGEGDAEPDVVLSRSGDSWVLSSHDDYPAKGDKVDALLAELGQAKVRAPIATTKSRQAQLRVAANDFRKKVVVTTAKGEIAFFVGDFAAAGTVALRLADDDAIYAVASAVSSASTPSVRGWVDSSIVEVATDEIASLAVQTPAGSYVLDLLPGGKEWQLASGPETGKPLDQTFVNRMAGKLAHLNLSDIAGAKALPEYGLATPRATVTVTLKPDPAAASANDASTPAASVAGEIVTFTVGGENEDGRVYVKSGSGPYVFEVSGPSVKPFIEAGPDTLFQVDKPETADAPKATRKPTSPKPPAP